MLFITIFCTLILVQIYFTCFKLLFCYFFTPKCTQSGVYTMFSLSVCWFLVQIISLTEQKNTKTYRNRDILWYSEDVRCSPWMFSHLVCRAFSTQLPSNTLQKNLFVISPIFFLTMFQPCVVAVINNRYYVFRKYFWSLCVEFVRVNAVVNIIPS